MYVRKRVFIVVALHILLSCSLMVVSTHLSICPNHTAIVYTCSAGQLVEWVNAGCLVDRWCVRRHGAVLLLLLLLFLLPGKTSESERLARVLKEVEVRDGLVVGTINSTWAGDD